MLRQTSLGTLGLAVGGIITVVGFYAYFNDYATLNLAGFFYGIPLLLGGLALKAAELKPLPFSQPTPPEILDLREQLATPIQNQIRKDVTRYRYGQEAHLDDTLARLGLSPSDEARPLLEGIREMKIDDAYALILEFDSPKIPLSTWQEKQEKMTKFFGPGIRVEVNQPAENRVEVALISLNRTDKNAA
ncbi:DUF2854 domain-containing protein [Phormidium sp. CCY1219]|uniref:DUF2854 domain-containing protein n=1 Tax=Phormidium sp. CCY1219 TaxID=2886104 RepID=UPI002D1EABFF|nr:DUF2854 domain-containing protein [Phormidium sp. CCY1219]MEB3828043.1 DUF2854 domain-containing protein [Phormidium sp. CCY1219]